MAKRPIGVNPTPPFAAFNSLFIINAPQIGRNTLLRVTRDAPRAIEVATPGSPWGIAVGGGSLWVGGRNDRVVWRMNPRTARMTASVRLPEFARGLTFARGVLWVTTATSLVRIDPVWNRVVRRIRLAAPEPGDAGLTGIGYLNGSVWVSVI